jgi:hypothetical protein
MIVYGFRYWGGPNDGQDIPVSLPPAPTITVWRPAWEGGRAFGRQIMGAYHLDLPAMLYRWRQDDTTQESTA